MKKGPSNLHFKSPYCVLKIYPWREGLPAAISEGGSQQKNRSAALRASFFIPVRFCPSKLGRRSRKRKMHPFGGALLFFCCGERGIRTPGSVTFNSFQDCRNRPLCHLSGRKIMSLSLNCQIFLLHFLPLRKFLV